MRKRTLVSWSSGKDCAWALHLLREDPSVEVAGLFSVLNDRHDRVSMHATRAELLRRQAEAAGLPLETVRLPDPCSGERYGQIMDGCVARFAAAGIERMAFGDLYLEPVRRHREERMSGTGIDTLFPAWRIPTDELAGRMLAAGVEAYLSCVDLAKLPARFAGRRWSRELLAELPPGIDPCGENGEFHSVVVDGPFFSGRIAVEIGEVVQRDGCAYADIVPRG